MHFDGIQVQEKVG